MTDLPDDEVDHLLSRGGLGREHKEHLLRGVLASVAVPPPARRQRRWLWQTVAGLSLAGGVATFALWGRPSDGARPTFRAKGAPASAPVVGMLLSRRVSPRLSERFADRFLVGEETPKTRGSSRPTQTHSRAARASGI